MAAGASVQGIQGRGPHLTPAGSKKSGLIHVEAKQTPKWQGASLRGSNPRTTELLLDTRPDPIHLVAAQSKDLGMLKDERTDKGGLLMMLTRQLRGNTVLHGSSPC